MNNDMVIKISVTSKCDEREARYLSKAAAREKALESLRFLNMIENKMISFHDDWSDIEQAKSCIRNALDYLDSALGE